MRTEEETEAFKLRCQKLLDFLTNHMSTEETDSSVWSAVLSVIASGIINAQNDRTKAFHMIVSAIMELCKEEEKECQKTNT